jgi:hypothetical protein
VDARKSDGTSRKCGNREPALAWQAAAKQSLEKNTRDQREHGWKRPRKFSPTPNLAVPRFGESWKFQFQVPFHDPSNLDVVRGEQWPMHFPSNFPSHATLGVLGAARLGQPGFQGLEGRARAARSSGGRRARATLTRPHLTPPHPELHLADSPSSPSIHVKGKGCRPS